MSLSDIEKFQKTFSVLVGGVVTDFRIGISTKLYVNKGSEVFLIGFGDCELLIKGKLFNIVSEKIETKQILLSLFEKKVTEVSINKGGDLSVSFEEGSTILNKSALTVEAWEISGPNGLLCVCTPGGIISIF